MDLASLAQQLEVAAAGRAGSFRSPADGTAVSLPVPPTSPVLPAGQRIPETWVILSELPTTDPTGPG
jgi:hypothetical protein